MASSSGTSSASTLMQNSGSETDLLDERKRKRMISNRDSARRSRMRKQKQLDDLIAQVGQLRNENSQIISTIKKTTHHYLDIEGENLVLRAQHEELNYRLQYLNQIISKLNSRSTVQYELEGHYDSTMFDYNDGLFNHWNPTYLTQQQQPIMASLEMFQY